MATAAIQMNGVRPRITTENTIHISNGRHVLYETTYSNYRTNSFASAADKKRVTLVTGPNASGKTMYLKQASREYNTGYTHFRYRLD